MSIKRVIFLFFMNVFDDAVAALWAKSCALGDSVTAVVMSGVLTFTVAYSVKSYIKDYRYIVPILCGSMLGCYVAVRFL